jgi:hypothetical protein
MKKRSRSCTGSHDSLCATTVNLIEVKNEDGLRKAAMEQQRCLLWELGSRQCPLWVKSGHRSASSQCPLYPFDVCYSPKADIEVFGQLERVLPLVPATMTIPSNAGSDHYCDHHDQDGRVHAASMCDTPQARHSKV